LKRDAGQDGRETSCFLEERFGRNLDLSLAALAKSAIKRRIAGALTADVDLTATRLPEGWGSTRGTTGLGEDDIYLFPCGMNAIFNVHRVLLRARGDLASISFGFPYVDTLKILQKYGPGCIFYGHASESDLDELESRLKDGERFLALFCEFPGNPLLGCPDLVRVRHLAAAYDFAVVVDETIGTFANINVLPFADVVVSSLTKIFSGDCNVMGGSAVLNPKGRYYANLQTVMAEEVEDTYWPEDVIFMERNSRDFASRIDRVNTNAEAICDVLRSDPSVKKVYYPKFHETRPNYDVCKLANGGYGGLLSVTFHHRSQAVAFFDAIQTAKGPSLGTNFTLTSPYVVLAHYRELDWAASYGVDPDLIRISVGVEETGRLVAAFEDALRIATNAKQT
jgi:cystathionine gamma-synthase